MVQVIQRHKQLVFGLTVESEIPLPETFPAAEELLEDVTISRARLREEFSMKKQEDSLYVYEDNRVLFQVPHVGIFSVEQGNTIQSCPYPGVSASQERLFLLGTCMGVLLMQRGILPLHGSAVTVGGKAYAILGDSGAGKSTLTAALLQRGCRLLSDDVIPVIFDNLTPIAIPSYPQQKLWQTSLDAFGMDNSGYLQLVDRKTKYAVPVQEHFTQEATPLAGVIELVKTNEDEVKLTSVIQLEKLHLLSMHTYRSFMIPYFSLTAWHFQYAAKLAASIHVNRLLRPAETFTVWELAELLMKKWEEDQ